MYLESFFYFVIIKLSKFIITAVFPLTKKEPLKCTSDGIHIKLCELKSFLQHKHVIDIFYISSNYLLPQLSFVTFFLHMSLCRMCNVPRLFILSFSHSDLH